MTEWAKWRDKVALACDGSHQTIDTIEADIAAGNALPLYADGCCFIIEIHNYPGSRACQVMWAAGDLPAILKALPDLHAWAKLQGCTEMLAEGHPGWQRALKPLGWKLWSVTMRMPLHGD